MGKRFAVVVLVLSFILASTRLIFANPSEEQAIKDTQAKYAQFNLHDFQFTSGWVEDWDDMKNKDLGRSPDITKIAVTVKGTDGGQNKIYKGLIIYKIPSNPSNPYTYSRFFVSTTEKA